MIELGDTVKIKKEQVIDLNIINNLTSTSTTDVLSANQGRILNEKIEEIILYDNATGTTGTITLSETSANFTYLEMFFKDGTSVAGDYSGHASCKVYSPNGKKANMCLMEVNANSEIWLKMRTILISGTSITTNIVGQANFSNSAQQVYKDSNNVYITRVVGYR